ncbi:MAG: hypothetical protein H7259_01395 [Cytophagales bacterium]|nr:hypothetical protein [Cytophaga sp.]
MSIWDTPEYIEYANASREDQDCREWELKKQIKKAGLNYTKYCCIQIAYYLIEEKKSKGKEEINYDSIITCNSKRKSFGLPIHDGGSSYIKIYFCPWCGQKL